MKKITSCFQFMLLEIKKIVRSPILLFFVIFAPIIIVCSLGIFFNNSISFTNQNNNKHDIVFIKQGDGDVSNIENIFVSYFTDQSIEWVEDFEAAKNDLKLEKISLIVVVNTNKDPADCIVYYNPYNTKSTAFLTHVDILKGVYSYITVKDYLADWGIEIDDEYFNLSTNEPIEDVNSNQITVLIPNILTISMAFLIVIMSAYMFSRDNETGISKILAYTPISKKDYILTKAVLIFAISVLHCLVIVAILPIFNIQYLGSYIGSVSLLIFNCFVYVSVCTLLSVIQKQISSIAIGITAIIIPLIVVTSIDLSGINTFLLIAIYLFPATSGMQMLKYYMHYGIFAWEFFVIQVAFFIASVIGLIIFFKIKYKYSLQNQTIKNKQNLKKYDA